MNENDIARNLVIGVTVRRGDPEWVQKSTRNYLNALTEFTVCSPHAS